jgi:hypothetical protein
MPNLAEQIFERFVKRSGFDGFWWWRPPEEDHKVEEKERKELEEGKEWP